MVMGMMMVSNDAESGFYEVVGEIPRMMAAMGKETVRVDKLQGMRDQCKLPNMTEVDD